MKKIDDMLYKVILGFILILCFIPWSGLRRTVVRWIAIIGLILLAYYAGYTSPKGE